MKIKVLVKPNTRNQKVVEEASGRYVVYTRMPTKEGKANEAVIKALSNHLKISPSRITIVRGARSREKILEIQ